MKLRQAQQRILKACAVALALHLLLLSTLPGVPEFQLPNFDSGTSLLVFLEQSEDPEVLDQSLNLPLPTPELETQSVQQQVAIANDSLGDEALPSEATPEVVAPEQNGKASQASGKPQKVALSYVTRKLCASLNN